MFSSRTNWKLAPNRFTQTLTELRAAGATILDLTHSNPTRIGLHYDDAAIPSALASPHSLDYDPQSKGLLSARKAVADYYSERHSVREIDPEQVILTTSTSEGYSFVFRLLCNAGDELLVPKPSYPLFEFLADLQDVKLVPYPLIYDHGWQMDFHSLEKAVTARTRGVVVVHPNNPTGSCVQPHELKLLNTFCRERGMAVIADEVFLDYVLEPGTAHGGTDASVGSVERSSTVVDAATNARSLHAPVDRLPPIHKLGRDDKALASFAANHDLLTFTLSGLSKISALPQMKVAWVVTTGPREQAAEALARLEIIADTYLSMNAPIQWALPQLLAQRENIQRQILQRVRNNLAELDRQLAGQKSCERLRVEAGWYAVLRVPVTCSDEELVIELLREKSVLVHPGHFYDFPSDGYLVLSLIAPEKEFGTGLSRVLQHLNQ
jgi:alanine-synthesizing transaminase